MMRNKKNSYLLLIALSCVAFLIHVQITYGQTSVEGTVHDSDGGPIPGASVRLLKNGHVDMTRESGKFSFAAAKLPDTLLVSHIGYMPSRIAIDSAFAFPVSVILHKEGVALEEVMVSTGFYQVPKERATGSFAYVDGEKLNMTTGTDILSRLEGMTEGLQFVQQGDGGEPELRVRGLSTIESNRSPLIVVDNFPYEGDLMNINPNDVDYVTVLRDAAAASIWGARAGNGVIVITTKKGKFNQPTTISFNSNVRIESRPDFGNNQAWLPADAVMEIEYERFSRGDYPEEPQTPIPGYVELLIKRRDGLITEEEFAAMKAILKQTDVREEALKHLYRTDVSQQYALNIRGGGSVYSYALSGGYDRNASRVVGNNFSRLNLSANNHLLLGRKFSATAAIWYTRQERENNGVELSDLRSTSSYVGLSPYTQLVDDQGNVAAIIKDFRRAYKQTAPEEGLLDWEYRPLEERTLNSNQASDTEVRLNAGLNYDAVSGLQLKALYQYEWRSSAQNILYDKDSYYVRNLVNRFTQPDGTLVIPHEGILNVRGLHDGEAHTARLLADFNRTFGRHNLAAVAGAEGRQITSGSFPGSMLYGYDGESLRGETLLNYQQLYPVRPTGRLRISNPYTGASSYMDRYLSYFGNVAYSVGAYVFSGSARWDGSNLFGIKTNQRGKALWSLGGSWEISKEDFYRMDELPYLRLRLTYGSSGNVNKSVTHYPTISRSGTDAVSGLPIAAIINIGNPSLRWEEVLTTNAGLDFRTKSNRISGAIEWYVKASSDLIGDEYMDPTTGITGDYKINYADMRTNGWDIRLTSQNTVGKFKWETSALFSYVRNKITDFNTNEVTSLSYFFTGHPPVTGRSLDAIYTLPWWGLDHQTGMPLVELDGHTTTDYKAFYDYYNANAVDRLVVAGVEVPPYYGSLRNSFEWKRIQFHVLLTWKAGYLFRRQSIAPAAEYDGPVYYHTDYLKRWKAPGDELHTTVPAASPEADNYLQSFYGYSAALLTKGAHIRLQNVQLAYNLPIRNINGIKDIRLYANAQNLGVVWKANKQGLDPDYHQSTYIPPAVFALGMNINF